MVAKGLRWVVVLLSRNLLLLGRPFFLRTGWCGLWDINGSSCRHGLSKLQNFTSLVQDGLSGPSYTFQFNNLLTHPSDCMMIKTRTGQWLTLLWLRCRQIRFNNSCHSLA